VISIVIPCFNERENIARFPESLFPILKSLGEEFELIVVDDGSNDGSQEILRRFEKSQGIKLITHRENRGFGKALKSGFAASAGEWILVLDADLTFSPRQIPRLIENQRRNLSDMVSGSPWIGDGLSSRVLFFRRALSRLANLSYRLAWGIPFSSFTSIFRLYRSSCLKSLAVQSEGFEINAEIAALFWIYGFKVSEIPAALENRQYGKSKLNLYRELRAHLLLIFRLMKLVRMNP
jgi:dolichol-phosphate mannosyltransferase